MDYNFNRISSIKDILIKEKKTLAVAESVTSGHLQAALSQAKDASSFFQGGITAYNYGQKCRHLHIEPIHALKCNCVSEQVAAQMAIGAAKLFLSDYGIAITGYASRVPEIGVTDLFAIVAICFKRKVLLVEQIVSSVNDEGLNIQVDYTNRILELFENLLKANVSN